MPSHKRRVVLDTNVIVSAVLTKGKSFELLTLWRKGRFDIVVCSDIFEEYLAVLSRDKFCLSISLVKIILDEIAQKAIWVNKVPKLDIVTDDPADNKFIETALAASSDYIVSGDKHLLELTKFKSIAILPPADFMRLLK